MNVLPIQQRHPHYDAMRSKWARYRAFGGGDGGHTPTDNEWLPRGTYEDSADYAMRRRLTHDIGWTKPALRRIGGTLTRQGAEYSTEGSELPPALIEEVQAFLANADGAGTSLQAWWSEHIEEPLRMGVMGVEIARRGRDMPDDELGLPFLCPWRAEEIINWRVDDRGALLWVVLERESSEQADPNASRVNRHTVRVLTRETGTQYEIVRDEDDGARANVTAEWEHGLGVVPFVPVYATRREPMHGESYVDGITLGDWRLLQLESDQSYASWLHGSPRLVIATRSPLEEVAGGSENILKIDPDQNEDVRYLQVDTGGMNTREAVIERTSRQILNSAGIDPSAVVQGGSSSARSGVSMAWSFSTAEEPVLTRFTASMDRADRQILECVVRYLMPDDATPPGPADRMADLTVRRVPKWDLMDADRTVDIAQAARDLVPSRTLQEHLALDIAQRARPQAEAADVQTYADEIAAAPQFALMPSLELTDDEAGDADEIPEALIDSAGGDE